MCVNILNNSEYWITLISVYLNKYVSSVPNLFTQRKMLKVCKRLYNPYWKTISQNYTIYILKTFWPLLYMANLLRTHMCCNFKKERQHKYRKFLNKFSIKKKSHWMFPGFKWGRPLTYSHNTTQNIAACKKL